MKAEKAGQPHPLRACPGGMQALHPDGYVVYRRRGAHSQYWLHSEGTYEAGFRTLDELAAELRARGASAMYSLPLGGEVSAAYEDLPSEEARALLALVRASGPRHIAFE